MEVVSTIAALQGYLEHARTVMPKVSMFPKSIFSVRPLSTAFFDFGYRTSRELFAILLHLCEINDEAGFAFMMTQPDPVDYFYRHFGWLPAARISRNDNFDAFGQFVTRDPGNSPADAIAYHADEIMIVSDALSFVVYGCQRFELAVIATFTKAVNFQRLAELKSAPLVPMDYDMAFEYLRQFKNFSIERDEFVSSWKSTTNQLDYGDSAFN